MLKYTVRRANEKDIDAVAGLELMCFAHPWTHAAIEKDILTNELAMYYVAEAEAGIIGYASLWAVFPDANINNVAVHPACRQIGVGSAILDRMIEETTLLGIESYNLEVRPSNDPAIKLYIKHGFEVKGKRPGYYEDNGEDALIMVRSNPQK